MHPETERMMHSFVLEFHFHLIGTRRERTDTRFFHVCRNFPTVKLAVKLLRVARKLFWAGRKKGPFKGILSSRSERYAIVLGGFYFPSACSIRKKEY